MLNLREYVPRALAAVAAGMGAMLAITGCVDVSPGPSLTKAEYCEARAELDCRVYWTCFDIGLREQTRAELALRGLDIGASRAQCETNLKAACATKPFACGANETFQEMKAGACIAGLETLSCQDWNGDNSDSIAACRLICTPRL